MAYAASGAIVAQGLRALAALCLAGFLAGCSTPPLESARANFYAGRFGQADKNLAEIPKNNKDTSLYLMERGMIRQNLPDYDLSCRDWREAGERMRLLETYSLTHGAASLVTNDRMLEFQGAPYERTLLYAFLAKDYLAQFNWDYAAICARNIIMQLEHLNGFPDVAYGRYLAGFCLELIDDDGNAAIQYRAAAKLPHNFVLDEDTGRMQVKVDTNRTGGAASLLEPPMPTPALPAELVCFIGIGRVPPGESNLRYFGEAPYAEIYCGDKLLGRSFPFSSTAALLAATERRMAAIQMAKDLTRIAVKESIAQSIEHQNECLGLLARILLYATEMPDTRRWETLPLWLEVARVPCPAKLEEVTIVFTTGGGHKFMKKTIQSPLVHRGNIWVAFCRDIE